MHKDSNNINTTPFSIFAANLNFSDFIQIYCDISPNSCIFLIDTQADISIIKNTSLYNYVNLNSNDYIDIKGITNNSIQSLGSINAQLNINGYKIIQKLHVVSEEFNIPSDGILGRDFLKTFNCKIDYSNKTLTINADTRKIILNILEGPDEDTFVIPPRCEVIRRFNIQTKNETTRFVPNQELTPGIFTTNTIIDPRNAYVRIINTTNETKVVPRNNLISESMEDYIVVDFKKIDPNRNTTLLNILTKDIPQNVKPELSKLCSDFAEVFALESDKMTVNNFYTQHIRTVDKEPVYIKNYRIPHTQKVEANRQVNLFLKNNLIEHSTSNYNSPIIIVPKKEKGKWRMCIDYRLVNKKIVADKFPLPRIDEILDGLGRARYFSVLDLFQGFHQIPLDEESRDLTSFSTDTGSFRWKVLPFGLNIAPNSFARMMSIAFSGLTPTHCFLYMDDLIVTGTSERHHLDNLKSVFKALKKYNLKLNPYKCKFFRPEVTYLGHRCTQNGVLPDNSKIDTMINYPIPTDKDSVKRFVAFANYYRKFIKNFASIAAPLNKLTRKNSKFEWTNECTNSFNFLKNNLISPPILQYPDFSQKFIITVDASKYGTGAILSQLHDNEDLPIAYASKSFTKGESNKPTIEQELIAIHFAIKHFRPYIYGTNFLVKSDHRPLVYLFGLKDPSSKLTRIRLDLEEYNFTVEHIKGKDNVGADALSRMSNINNSLSIDDLKNLHKETKYVRVLTRSMKNKNLINESAEINENPTKINENMQNNENANSAHNINIYEELGSFNYNKIPKIKFTRFKNDNNPRIEIVVYFRNKILTQLNTSNLIINEKLSLATILSQLENTANKFNLEKMHIQLNDIIFDKIPIEEFKNVGNKVLQKLKIVLTKPVQIVSNEDEKLAILKQYHDNPIEGGHSGQKRLYAKIRTKYYWKNMSKTIQNYVRQCNECQINKTQKHTKEELTITKTPQKPFDIVTIDTIGPLLPSDQGNKYAVTLICNLTKYLITVAVSNKESKTIAKAIFDKFILTYGPMRQILTDSGTEYKNQTLTELCNILQINLIHSTPHHHETVGTVERNHRTLNEYLRTYLNENRTNWEECMKYFTYCYNITSNSSLNLKFTPYELVFGKIPNDLNIFMNNKIDPLYNVDNYAKELKYRLQIAHTIAKELINISKEKSKKHYDKRVKPIELKIGDKILVTNEEGHKHEKLYLGPYTITKIIDNNVEILDENKIKTTIVHKNRVKKYISK